MILPPIPQALKDVPATVNQWKRLLEQADGQNQKRGTDMVLGRGARLILLSPNGTQYAVTVDNAGNLSAVAV